MFTKDKLIEAIREVPISQTYEEYVEALAKKILGTKTHFDRIRSMTVDEMASYFAYISGRGDGFITVADHYICHKCKKEHGGKCPVSDDEKCLHDNDNTSTIKYWLESEVEE